MRRAAENIEEITSLRRCGQRRFHHRYTCTSPSYLPRKHTTVRYQSSPARFTQYLTTIPRLSYDNAKVTIDLRWTVWTSNLQKKHLTKSARLLGMINSQNRNIVRDSVRKPAYDIPERILSTFKSLS